MAVATPRSAPEAGRTTAWTGCSVHRTPQGEVCSGCLRQGELITRGEAARQTAKWRG
jgi:hypothetical protein